MPSVLKASGIPSAIDQTNVCYPIFKQCCEKGTRERCRPNLDVLARERERVGVRL